jgi:hypothetical protein
MRLNCSATCEIPSDSIGHYHSTLLSLGCCSDSYMTRNPSTPTLTLSTAFELLASAYRRHILHYFHGTEGESATLSELGSHVQTALAEEHEEHRVRLRLHHQHLPKLADHNVIDYDRRSETVRYWGSSQLEALRSLTASIDRS